MKEVELDPCGKCWGRVKVKWGEESIFSIETSGWAHRQCCDLVSEEANHILSLDLEKVKSATCEPPWDRCRQSLNVGTCLLNPTDWICHLL